MWTLNATILDESANSTPAHTLTHTRPFNPIRAFQDGASPNQCTLGGFRCVAYRGSELGHRSIRAETLEEGMDAMQLSKHRLTATVSVSPQGRKAMSAKVLSLSRGGIRASVRGEPGVIETEDGEGGGDAPNFTPVHGLFLVALRPLRRPGWGSSMCGSAFLLLPPSRR